MKRSLIIKLHLILAGFFLPFLIIVPLSGGLYLAGEKGTFVEGESFILKERLPETQELLENRVWEIFREQGISYEFENARMRDDGADLRPTSRPYYRIRYKDDGTHFTYIKPDIWALLMELHKGHGPRGFKWLQVFFALGLLSIGVSGVYLAFTVTSYRRPLFISAGLGFALFIFLHNL